MPVNRYLGSSSSLWPGRVVDLNQPKDRRQEPKRKKNGESEEAQCQSSAKKK